MTKPVIKPITLLTPAPLFDHRFMDRPVLPAVYALSIIGNAVLEHFPDIDICSQSKAAFFRFLPMEKPDALLEAKVEIVPKENGVAAKLITITKARASGITRQKLHVEITFDEGRKIQPPFADEACCLEGVCLRLDPGYLYESMVPFGPAFQNVSGPIFLSENGAVAVVTAGQINAGFNLPFGAPLALDAAFHVACAWGQRFAGFVGFPVGFEKRTVYKTALPDRKYFCRAFPVERKNRSLFFDLWLFDQDGSPVDGVLGLEMADISKGRLAVPEWIDAKQDDPYLAAFKKHCEDFSLIEIDTIFPFAKTAFSKREAGRFDQLGSRRKISYSASRIALKRLGRKLFDTENQIDSTQIETLAKDSEHPACFTPVQTKGICATTSHNDRFVIAVASKRRIGVDVEKPSTRMIRGMRLFMNDSEKSVVSGSGMEQLSAVARVWTLKEAAAKALDLPLASARSRVIVKKIGAANSRAEVDGDLVKAYHETIDDHLFTIIQLDGKT